MKRLKEAMSLIEGPTDYTVSSFQKLTELRDNAVGDEAALLGRLVETFIAQAPPDILKQIMRML
ncbi:MAG TPA: hypothetical protein V6D29_16625 [Leptolyngbyaceae cyanobacterium]